MANDPLDIPQQGSQPSPDPPQKDHDSASYKYAKALCEAARSASSRINSFKKNWDILLGRHQWRPGTQSRTVAEWAFNGVVNWIFATIKTKAAMITSAPVNVFVDPLDDQSTYYDRLLWKSALEHEASRLRLRSIGKDCYLNGSVTGVGVAMVTAKPDPLTGIMKLVATPIKSTEFFRDPSADSITSPDCRYVVWEPEMDMSVIREMFPSKAMYVKPETRQVTGGWTYKPDSSDDNLIYGTGGDFQIDKSNTLQSRKAKVNFVWIRDESLITDLQTVIIAPEGPGYVCNGCQTVYEDQAVDASSCPMCGGDMENTTVPAKVQENNVIRRAYPYGRLIAYAGKTLLFDGENPYELEGVFPFFVYHHDRIPGDFYGTNDVDLLSSLQEAQDTTVCELIDYVRLAANGHLIVPIGAKSFENLGNGPKQIHYTPPDLCHLIRYVSPTDFNIQAWGSLISAIRENFGVVSGLSGPSLGQNSSPPISATEVEVTNQRLSDRMKGHADEYSQFLSDGYQIIAQMMQQFYEEPMNVAVSMPDSEVKSIAIEVQQLPKVRFRVEVNTQEAIKDKQIGQNIGLFAQQGGLESPHADIVLEAFGVPSIRIKELLQRRGLQQELSPPGMAGPGVPQAPGAPRGQPMPGQNLQLVPGGNPNG